MLKIKRVYEPVEPDDGVRFLVERLWPRGVKKEDAHIQQWLKDVAPSDELRRWFEHDPAKWDEFKKRYDQELSHNRDALAPIIEAERKGNVTLIYSARDTEHNNALALKEYLDQHHLTK